MTVPGGAVTLDEMELESEAGKEPVVEKPNFQDMKLDGDDVPELLRGKSVADALRTVDTMAQSLRMSETERQALRARIDSTPVPQAVEEEPVWDREKLREMYEQDPIAAMEAMGNHLSDNLNRHFETRLQPLANGTVIAAEQAAKQRYETEFSMFGDQIEQFKKGLPDRSVLASSQGWDDMISYIRGRPENFDRMIVARSGPQKQAARQEQVQNTGFSAAPAGSAIPVAGGDLDVTTQKIAQSFIDQGIFKDMNEYKRWQAAGGA